MAASAQAALQGRAPATQGGTDYQAFYDTDLKITWLANANLAATNDFGVSGISAGIMNWNTANAWIDAMNVAKYLGLNSWRLPNTTQPDPTCSGQSQFPGLPLQGYLFSCTGSETGYLYYVDHVSVFTNVQADYYWSGTYFAASSFFNESDAWIFSFSNGSQNTRGVSYGICANCDGYAWPAAPGDPFAPNACRGLPRIGRVRAESLYGYQRDPNIQILYDGSQYYYEIVSTDSTDPADCTFDGKVEETVTTTFSTCLAPRLHDFPASSPVEQGSNPFGFASWIPDIVAEPRIPVEITSCYSLRKQLLTWDSPTRGTLNFAPNLQRVDIVIDHVNGSFIYTTSFGQPPQETPWGGP